MCHAKMCEKKDSILKFAQESGRWRPGMSHGSEDNREQRDSAVRTAASWKALKAELNCPARIGVTSGRHVQAFAMVT